MVNVEIRRKPMPAPEPLPTRASDGSGWVQCQQCGHHRTVSREQIMTGTWTRCPFCQRDEPPKPVAHNVIYYI